MENRDTETGSCLIGVIVVFLGVFFLIKFIIGNIQLQPKVDEVKTFVVVPWTEDKAKAEVTELFKQAGVKPKFVAVSEQSQNKSELCDSYDKNQSSIIDPSDKQWSKAFDKAGLDNFVYYAKKGATIIVPYHKYVLEKSNNTSESEKIQSSTTNSSIKESTEDSSLWISDKVKLPEKLAIQLDEDVDYEYYQIFTELGSNIDMDKLNTYINSKWLDAKAKVINTGSSASVDGGSFAQLVESIGYTSKDKPLQITLVDNWSEVKDESPNMWSEFSVLNDVSHWVEDGLNNQGKKENSYPWPSIEVYYKGTLLYQTAYYYKLDDYCEAELVPTKEGELF